MRDQNMVRERERDIKMERERKQYKDNILEIYGEYSKVLEIIKKNIRGGRIRTPYTRKKIGSR